MGMGERPWMEARDIYMGIWDLDTGDVLRPEDLEPMAEGKTSSPVEVKFVHHVTLLASTFSSFCHSYPCFSPRSNPIRAISCIHTTSAYPQVFLDGFGLHGCAAFSEHYYDGLTLITRHWNWFNADALGVIRGHYSSPVFALKIGEAAIRKFIQEQLGILKADTLTVTGDEGIYPSIIDADADVDSSKLQLQQQGLGNKDYDSSSRLQLQQQGGDEEVSMYGIGRDDSQTILQEPVEIIQQVSTWYSSAAPFPPEVPPLLHLIPNLRRTSLRTVSCPSPVKTIGTPSDIQFNIASAVFRLTVRVMIGEDRVGVHPLGLGNLEDLATEIFVPVVHYARPRLLSSSSSAAAAEGGGFGGA
ncbi:hypothetical protein BT96DRAFT_1000423 [Gymnopus androsaceus JB14]|uniref:Glycoside hydrolase family 5 C-terminal domain-containing protein n=1 Tax=Gymnopus androsaceus JB14 TaxID=1447944 RepID=A0A6A4H3V6_9AGAR|nr:hypothetical protein BT96DRAFT_1000423 [Gymnopus androsaceus JB14]